MHHSITINYCYKWQSCCLIQNFIFPPLQRTTGSLIRVIRIRDAKELLTNLFLLFLISFTAGMHILSFAQINARFGSERLRKVKKHVEVVADSLCTSTTDSANPSPGFRGRCCPTIYRALNRCRRQLIMGK